MRQRNESHLSVSNHVTAKWTSLIWHSQKGSKQSRKVNQVKRTQLSTSQNTVSKSKVPFLTEIESQRVPRKMVQVHLSISIKPFIISWYSIKHFHK